MESGQFFRYKKFSSFYYVNTKDTVFAVRQHNGQLIYDGIDEAHLKHFLGINDNYNKIIKNVETDKVMKGLTKKYHGLRLLRQDPWECTVSYVCSSAANIPKIQKNVNMLSYHFGRPVKVAGYTSHSFPEPSSMVCLDTIKECKTGFRANYLYKLNDALTTKRIEHLTTMNYEDAHNILTQLPGIGPKVADCIALFSLGHTEAFPVDTWIKKIMEKHYFNNKTTANNKIKEFAQDRWGKYAGYAQMFLYMERN